MLILIPAGIMLLPLCIRLQRQYSRSPKPQTTPAYQPQSGPPPRFVTYNLAGVNLLSPGKFGGKCDLKNDYCVIAADGPDRCELTLELSLSQEYRRRFSVTPEEMKQKFKNVHLPLVTGRGVRIGDTPRKVRERIGEPTEKKAQDLVTINYRYIYRGKNRLYSADYRFYQGKLVSIGFRDERAPDKNIPVPGCP